MEFSLFPFDVQRCQVKIQVRKLRGKSPGKASKPFSHYDDDVSGVAVKGQTGPEDPPRFELQSRFWDLNWFEDLGGGDMAPIFQNAHLDYEIEVHHLPEEVRQVFFNN